MQPKTLAFMAIGVFALCGSAAMAQGHAGGYEIGSATGRAVAYHGGGYGYRHSGIGGYRGSYGYRRALVRSVGTMGLSVLPQCGLRPLCRHSISGRCTGCDGVFHAALRGASPSAAQLLVLLRRSRRLLPVHTAVQQRLDAGRAARRTPGPVRPSPDPKGHSRNAATAVQPGQRRQEQEWREGAEERALGLGATVAACCA